MTTLTTIRRAELAHTAEHPLVVVGHQVVGGRVSSREVPDSSALARFLDEVSGAVASATAWLELRASGYTPRTLPIEFPPSHFQFGVDAVRHVAAAAVLVVDRAGASHQWLSQGSAGHSDAVLVADPWNPVTRFPRESAITPAELRRAAAEWAFGEVFPPPAIRWRDASEDEIGWI
jgi:Immunity protein Imm1